MTDLIIFLGTTVEGFESFVTCWESLYYESVERGAGVGGRACKALKRSRDYQGCLCDILSQEVS